MIILASPHTLAMINFLYVTLKRNSGVKSMRFIYNNSYFRYDKPAVIESGSSSGYTYNERYYSFKKVTIFYDQYAIKVEMGGMSKSIEIKENLHSKIIELVNSIV